MAKRQGLWAEIQQERARRERARQRESREFQRAQAQMVREAAKAERDGKRQAAASERERKKLYIEDRKAEAAAMAADVGGRLTELDELLRAGIRDRPVVTFASLRRTGTYPPFDPGQLGEPLPAPVWEDFAPAPPSGIGKILGGTGRFERQLDGARTAYARAAEQHTAGEAGRCRELAAQRAAYDAAAAEFAAAAAEHNAGIDQFQRDCRAGNPEAVAEFCTLVMDSSLYAEGFPHCTRAVYRPDPKEAIIEWELPPQSVIPLDRDYRYVATRDAIDALPRAEKEIKERYRAVIAQVALRTIHEILISSPGQRDRTGDLLRLCLHRRSRDWPADPASAAPGKRGTRSIQHIPALRA